jgi:hypothetical protein
MAILTGPGNHPKLQSVDPYFRTFFFDHVLRPRSVAIYSWPWKSVLEIFPRFRTEFQSLGCNARLQKHSQILEICPEKSTKPKSAGP